MLRKSSGYVLNDFTTIAVTIGNYPLVSVVHEATLAALVFGLIAVNQLLLRQADQLASHNGINALN